MSASLQVENLNVHAHNVRRPIIEDLSFSIDPGRTLAFVGESGSGKTMTASAIMGLLPGGVHKHSGNIFILGEDISKWNAEEYRLARNQKISIVMQNPASAFDPVLTIRSHFWETLSSHGWKDNAEAMSAALAALERTGFEDPSGILELYPFQMSGGMLQRVMLAIALIASPPVIIADEATTDLDVVAQKRILTILKEHCRASNAALLLITHDFSVARFLADDVVLLKDGKVVEKNTAEVFFKTPRSEYAKKLLECHNSLFTPTYNKIISAINSKQGDSKQGDGYADNGRRGDGGAGDGGRGVKQEA